MWFRHNKKADPPTIKCRARASGFACQPHLSLILRSLNSIPQNNFRNQIVIDLFYSRFNLIVVRVSKYNIHCARSSYFPITSGGCTNITKGRSHASHPLSSSHSPLKFDWIVIAAESSLGSSATLTGCSSDAVKGLCVEKGSITSLGARVSCVCTCVCGTSQQPPSDQFWRRYAV